MKRLFVRLASAVLMMSAAMGQLVGCAADFNDEPLTANVTTIGCNNFASIAEKQESPTGCWATCAAMISRYRDRTETQGQIGARVLKAAGDPNHPDFARNIKAAGRMEIAHALCPESSNREFFEEYARRLEARESTGMSINLGDIWKYQTAYTDDEGRRLIDSMLKGSPVVAGLQGEQFPFGHAVVIYSIDYEVAGEDVGRKLWSSVSKTEGADVQNYSVIRVRYIDPSDGSMYEMKGSEFKRELDFILSDSDACSLLDLASNVIRWQ